MTNELSGLPSLREPMARLRELAIAAAVAAIALQWVNTRVAILQVNQNPSHPSIYDTYPVYHSMATGLREGRVGQTDLEALQRFSAQRDRWAAYDRVPAGAAHRWVNYYTLDVGYSFIVEAARLAFPSLPDNHLRSLALQLLVDAALVVFVFFVFSHWNLWLGLLAASLYSANVAAQQLVSLAFYYYWDIPLTFVVLGALILALQRPAETARWLTLAGLALGFGVWLRGSWWPLSLFLFVVARCTPALRRALVAPSVAFVLLATPQLVRSSIARGHLTLTTRAGWHVALVGLGYYPNPYGLELKDVAVFKLTKDKYGVDFNMVDYDVHDQAARREYFALWQKDRRFIIDSFLGRLGDSVAGSGESPSFTFVANPKYRVLCLIGFVLMILRGGASRVVGFAAGGTYAIYVLMTSTFYYVGLAYDNVTQVTLLILFVGGLDAAWRAGRRLLDCEDEWLARAG